MEKILEDIKTKQEANDLIDKLNMLEQSLFNTKNNFEKKLGTLLSYTQKETIMNFCSKNNIDMKNPKELAIFISELKKEIDNTPVLILYLAFQPTEKTLNCISKWFILNLKKKYFMEINTEKEIIGGCKIVFNGIYKDYSLKKSFDATVQNLA